MTRGGLHIPTDQADFDRIRKLMRMASDINSGKGLVASVIFDEPDTWMSTLASDDLYVLLAASFFSSEGRAFIDLHAGGAYDVRSDPTVFEALASAAWRVEFGGPWLRVSTGGAAYGWRERWPAELFAEPNQNNAFGFLTGMVHVFGGACNMLNEDLLSAYGGSPIRAADPEAWGALLRGYLPPQGDVDLTYKPGNGHYAPGPDVAEQPPKPTYRCPNPKCGDYGGILKSRQCPKCHHYSGSV